MTRLYSPSITGRLNRARPEWSAEDLRILNEFKDSKSAAAIGKLLTPPRSRNAVLIKADNLKICLTFQKGQHFTDEERTFIRDNSGTMCVAEIAKEIGRPEYAVRKHASYHGIKLRIPNDDAILMYQLRKTYSLSYKEIARKFEVSPGTVFYWCRKFENDESALNQTNEVKK
ncbi:helix-turn-helix domain-containing protein [Serratia marcescens]|uniref:helix-turn-helix domain-containing protein n=1 Tax=Serratia marcescens TaxID=615 RepID=UPI0036F64360